MLIDLNQNIEDAIQVSVGVKVLFVDKFQVSRSTFSHSLPLSFVFPIHEVPLRRFQVADQNRAGGDTRHPITNRAICQSEGRQNKGKGLSY